MWVKGTPLHFILDSGSPEEPHLNKGRQVVGIIDNTTPATIQHRVASPGMRSLCHPAVSIVIQHPTLQG
jgi:hypothetical protein